MPEIHPKRFVILCLVLFSTFCLPLLAVGEEAGLPGWTDNPPPRNVTTLLALAEKYRAEGRWTSALAFYSRAIKEARKDLDRLTRERGGDHPAVAEALDRLADLFLVRQDFIEKMDRDGDKETEELCDFVLQYERAEWIRTGLYGTPFHPSIARALDRTAELWRRCHPTMAEKFFKAAVTSREHIFGPTHLQVADACDRYARYLKLSMMDFKGARALYERALKIRETLLGEGRIEMIRNLPDLAETAFFSGDKNSAKMLVRRAVMTIQRNTAPPTPETAEILRSLGLIEGEMEDPGGARILLEKAVDMQERLFGPRHPKVAETIGDLALLFLNQDQPDRALALYNRALKILEFHYGRIHPELEAILIEMISLLEERGERSRAENLHRRLKQILKKKET